MKKAAQAKTETVRAEALHLFRSANFDAVASRPNEIAPQIHISILALLSATYYDITLYGRSTDSKRFGQVVET